MATVHKGGEYPEYCFKLIKDFVLYAEGVNVEKEADFLDALVDLKVNRVRTPKPFYSVMEDKKHFLVMETLPGENLAEIMERNLPLAEDFDFATLFSDLRGFVKEMNRRGIHHGDLHLGNIMLDRNSSQAYVIDFGSARYELGDTEIKESSTGGGKTLFYKKDEEKLKESESTFKLWLIKNKKLTEEQPWNK